MRLLRAKHRKDEEGAAVIEMLFAVPIAVLFAAGILDMSTYISYCIAADCATTAAVRYCMDEPSRFGDESSIKTYLAKVEPSLKTASLSLSEQPVRKQAYDHLFYIDESEQVITRKSYCTYQPFSIELTYRSEFKTLLGKSISLACGGDGSLVVRNKKAGALDKTDGDTW